MVKYQLACIGSTLCIYNQLLHVSFLLVGYFYNVNPSIQQGVVHIIWFPEFVRLITYLSGLFSLHSKFLIMSPAMLHSSTYVAI